MISKELWDQTIEHIGELLKGSGGDGKDLAYISFASLMSDMVATRICQAIELTGSRIAQGLSLAIDDAAASVADRIAQEMRRQAGEGGDDVSGS